MRRHRTWLAVAVVALVTGCGVTTQDEPERLTTTSPVPATTPQVTQRPDPSTTPPAATTRAPGTPSS